ncbi:unnamed protein product, partial [Oppiella nova]
VIDNRDAPLIQAEGLELENLVKGRQFLDNHFQAYVNSVEHLVNGDVVNTRSDLNNRECYHKFVDTFNDKCMNIAENSYVLGKLYQFVNICEQSSATGAEAALTQLADIYHAYQIVKANGIPDENIIVFHYDDIANNKENKYPGKVFNNPDHKDVYHGVPKDYTGDDVTPTNFLKVLLGDKDLESSGKKVLNSGPNDNVFVFFDDHGAVDLVAFPKTYLYGENLTSTLKEMHTQNKYNKLVFYIEACEAGSMFAKLLPTDINIYATTASSPTESSYAWYDDTELGTYLGDEYSIHWMEEAEQATDTTTLEDQFQWTKTKTTKSHVQHYGDLSIAKLPLSQFLGTYTKTLIYINLMNLHLLRRV